MPELPEVEVVRAGLDRYAAGRTVAAVTIGHPRAVRRHPAGPDDFVARLTGRRLGDAHRRGKFLWLPLDGGTALTAHLGMSGQLLIVPPDAAAGPHLRVRIGFADGGTELRFVDQRTFGGLAVAPLLDDGAGGRVPQPVAHIARDPLDPAFEPAGLWPALRRRRTGIKRALLDQTLVSGVGNIYADEALWRARLHYARRTETLTRAEVSRLLAALGDVFRAALAAGGTSFDHLYLDVDGRSGYFEPDLEVYGHRDRPCGRCGTPIRREPFMNRSSYFCPRCQPRPRRAHW